MSGIDRIMTAIAWALALSTLAAVVEVGWFGIEPLGLFSNRDFFAEAAAPVFVWLRCRDANRLDLRIRDQLSVHSRSLVWLFALGFPLILCGSRLAVLAAMAGIAIARPRWWWQTLIALPILAEFGTKAMGYHGKLASLKERGEIWHQTTIHITPWGRGMGWFAGAFPHYEWAHSDALQAAAEFGVGIVPFALIVAWLVWVSGPPMRVFYGTFWRYFWKQLWNKPDQGRLLMAWRMGGHALALHIQVWAKPDMRLRGPLVASLVTALGGFALHEAGSGLVAAVLAGGVVAGEARARRECNTLCVSGDSVDDHRRRATSGN